jgi:hypothetical protein
MYTFVQRKPPLVGANPGKILATMAGAGPGPGEKGAHLKGHRPGRGSGLYGKPSFTISCRPIQDTHRLANCIHQTQ